MKRMLVLLFALALATVGCSGLPSLSSLFPTATPYPTQTPYPTLVPLPTYTPYPTPVPTLRTAVPTMAPVVVGNVTIVNNSPDPVCQVFFSPSTDPLWGTNRMGPGVVIPVGGSRDFTVPTNVKMGQPYDFRTLSCAGMREGTFFAIPVYAAHLELTLN
jgi:hypothetical protein